MGGGRGSTPLGSVEVSVDKSKSTRLIEELLKRFDTTEVVICYQQVFGPISGKAMVKEVLEADVGELRMWARAIQGQQSMSILYKDDEEPRIVMPYAWMKGRSDGEIGVLAWCYRRKAFRWFKLCRVRSMFPMRYGTHDTIALAAFLRHDQNIRQNLMSTSDHQNLMREIGLV